MHATFLNKLSTRLLTAGVGALLAAPAAAQFPGDIYFANPTPAVVEGDSLTLSVELFAGTDVFGATAVDLFFDATTFQVDEVRAVTGGPLAATVHARSTSQGHAFAVFNDGSLSAPFGTMTLVEIVGTPLVAAGQSFQLTLQPRSLLDPSGANFPASAGLSATVTVVSGAAPQSAALPPDLPWIEGPVAPWIDPLWGNVPLRRPGYPLQLWTPGPEPYEPWVASWWRTYDPALPRERPLPQAPK